MNFKGPSEIERISGTVHGVQITSKKYGNQVCLVDSEDVPLLSKYRWCLCAGRNTLYAYCQINRNGKRKPMKMHYILAPKGEGIIDHWNGNGLDNRKPNLRRCTAIQNNANHRSRKKPKSGYWGVYPVKLSNGKVRWEARVSLKGKNVWRELFENPLEAARERDRRAVEIYGQFARLNIEVNIAPQ